MRTQSRQAGFTLIEMSIVVVLIAILASVAVPQLMSDDREATEDSEVNEMFSALSIAEAQYKLENGVYLSSAANETTTFPATPTNLPQSLTTSTPATWTTLKVNFPASTARCGYVVIAGAANAAPGSIASTSFGFTAPKVPYYYVLAHCNLDGDTTKDGYYFQSSLSSTIQSVNAGF